MTIFSAYPLGSQRSGWQSAYPIVSLPESDVMKALFTLLVLCGLAVSAAAQATIQVRDDAGQLLVLAAPAKRVVSLAPHVTELLFAAGGGKQVVGVVSHSDYPPEAQKLPQVGDNRQVDVERLLALKPDLLVVWRHGNAQRQLEPLRRLGIPLFYSEPTTLAAIPDTLIRLGRLLGTSAQAQLAAGQFSQQLDSLRRQYQQARPVRVFYQVWDKPLYTLNGQHIVSDALRVCGGVNVFANLPVTAPTVTQEAVIAANPEVMIAGDMGGRGGLDGWQRFPQLTAVRQQLLFTLEADTLHRPGPRMLEGTRQLCARLAQAREVLKK